MARMRWVLTLVLLLVPSPAPAQSSSDLVRWVISEVVSIDASDRPPWACVLVRPDQESPPRDVLPHELPPDDDSGVRFTGASECAEAREGAFHIASGEPAVIHKIGVGEITEEGEAWLTIGWFRAGLNAGASRCEAIWDGDGWVMGECQRLWISE